MHDTVVKMLTAARCRFQVHEHVPLVSAADYRAHLPIDPEAMVKTLAFHIDARGYVLAALKAFTKVDYKKLADALGVKRNHLRPASPDDVARDLGFEIGGICPFTDAPDVTVVIDLGVRDLETAYCGAGRNTATLELAADDLIRVSRGVLADIAK